MIAYLNPTFDTVHTGTDESRKYDKMNPVNMNKIIIYCKKVFHNPTELKERQFDKKNG